MNTSETAGPVGVTAGVTRVALLVGACGAVIADHVLADPATAHVALIAMGLFLGIPHGALDHVVASDVLVIRTGTAAAAYAVVAAAAWMVLHWGGALPLAAMIVVSIVHFGLGEVETWNIAGDIGVTGRSALVIAGAGCLVLPLARGGAGWDATLRALSPSLAGAFSTGAIQVVLVTIWTVSAVSSAHLFFRRRHWSAVVDIVIIGAVGAAVSPLVAFALWFGLWHGPRHIARLVEREMEGRRRSPSAGAVLTEIARRAAPVTLCAYATLAAVVGLVVGHGSTTDAVAAAIVVLLALTAPHMIVVATLDTSTRRGLRGADVSGRASRHACPQHEIR